MQHVVITTTADSIAPSNSATSSSGSLERPQVSPTVSAGHKQDRASSTGTATSGRSETTTDVPVRNGDDAENQQRQLRKRGSASMSAVSSAKADERSLKGGGNGGSSKPKRSRSETKAGVYCNGSIEGTDRPEPKKGKGKRNEKTDVKIRSTVVDDPTENETSASGRRGTRQRRGGGGDVLSSSSLPAAQSIGEIDIRNSADAKRATVYSDLKERDKNAGAGAEDRAVDFSGHEGNSSAKAKEVDGGHATAHDPGERWIHVDPVQGAVDQAEKVGGI